MVEGCKTLGEIEQPAKKAHSRKSRKPFVRPKTCPDCGGYYRGAVHECKLTRHHLFKLQEFAIEHGKTWKVAFRRTMTFAERALREARIIIGQGIYRIKVARYL